MIALAAIVAVVLYAAAMFAIGDYLRRRDQQRRPTNNFPGSM